MKERTLVTIDSSGMETACSTIRPVRPRWRAGIGRTRGLTVAI